MKDESAINTDRLGELILLMLDGNITEVDARLLQDEIRSCPALLDYYHDFLITCLGLKDGKMTAALKSQSDFTPADCTSLLMQMVEYEKNAPALKHDEPVGDVRPALIEHVGYGDAKFITLRWSSVISFIATAAAILFLVLFARFAPPKSNWEVATLTDSLHARWADDHVGVQNGMRLSAGTAPFDLESGFAKLLFDDQTAVTLEGPARFRILSGDRMALDFGKLYAIVTAEGYGFQVCTPSAEIVDLGTEFGVYQDPSGKTELHVIAGKTQLSSLLNGTFRNDFVETGSARRMDGATGRLEAIEYNPRLFARTIDSKANVVWRGPEEPLRPDLSSVQGSSGALLFADFEDGVRSGWYLTNGGRLSIVDDAAGIGSENALSLAIDSQDYHQRILSDFETVNLANVGDRISLRFDFRIASTTGFWKNGFRFGLFDSGMTRHGADNVMDNTTLSAADDKGFFVMQSVGSETIVRIVRERGETDSFMGGDDLSYHATDESFGGIQDDLKHSVLFTVTRTSYGMKLEYWLDDSRYLSCTSSKELSRFDVVGFAAADNLNCFMVDNIVVAFTPAP